MVIRKNKLIAVVTALILTIVTAVSFTSTADNSSLLYVKYNAKTGAYIGSYTLYSMPSSDNTRSIIGLDNRVVDWSKSGVVKIVSDVCYSDSNEPYRVMGTGFVVDEHVIATAGHCVADFNIDDILIFNSNGTIAMHATPVEKHFLKAYDDEHTTENDYALITVKEDLSDYMCFNLAATSGNIVGNTVKVTGFPGEHNNYNTHNMYTGSGTIQSISAKLLTYNADTTAGNSGGPVYITESYNGKTYYSVVAIHTAGGGSSNTGTRMTFDLLHFYANNSNISY